MAIQQTFWNLLQYPELSSLTLNQIIHAISLAHCLQHDIELPVENIKDLWTIIKDDVLEAPSREEDSKLNEECFQHYGWKRELSKEFSVS